MSEPWYRDGLRFECTGCGGCCTGAPGTVWVTEEEIVRMADYLKMSVEAFSKAYIRRIGERYSLKDLPRKNWDCVFLEGKRCTIYPVRPKQCQTFPWWSDHLDSPEAWARAAKGCEGIRDDAPLITFEQIQENLE